MATKVSGKIKSKEVKDAEYGAKNIRFVVLTKDGEKTVSQFSNRLTPETLGLMQELTIGDTVDFYVEEKEGKPKPGQRTPVYLNIVGAERYKDIADDVVTPPVHSDGQGKEHKKPFGDAPDSMILSYAKDGAVALSTPGDNPSEFVEKVFIIYGGLKAILAGIYGETPGE